jgi:short-subunit dehydrogenase
MRAQLDKRRFGAWALITGASSGIGKEFARQIAASGIHVALVARREALLRTVGAECTQAFGVQHRIIALDLSEPGFLPILADATRDLDVGLVVSNAGTGSPGRFLHKDREELKQLLRLNTAAHLDIAHHFGERLVRRGSGGLVFVGAMGADKGIPFMANDAGAKAYVQSLSLSLHEELKSCGVHVTVLPPAPTETPVLKKFGLDPATMAIKPMTVDRCVDEGLRALTKNRPVIIPGRINRIMNAVIPAAVVRGMMARMFAKTMAASATPPPS